MAIRAENDPKFSRRFLYMGIAAIGFSLWSLYDGTVAYPHKQERALAFEQLYSEGKTDQWEAFATERGWSTSIPEESKSEEDYKTSIVLQYSMFIVAGLIGIWLISIPLRARGRWIEGTGSGITSSWGQSFNYDQVENLEKRQWRKKGIARVTYIEDGRRRRFVIDDYKFDRYKTDAILYELEQNIDPERITGGPPDPPPGSEEVAEADADQAAVETE
jgi:hypothetical protein